jgi:Protein of unknown function (DUF2905)
LITFRAFTVLLGISWPYLGSLGLGRLPGDIVIERENCHVYVPILTALVLSAVANVIL